MRKILLLLVCLTLGPSVLQADPGRDRIQAAIDYLRDRASYLEARMIVHRPAWEREYGLRSWTRGNKESLVRFTAPPRDAGNASLTMGDEMWSFSPKINRVIKIPPSMMQQSWMGSDFSYDDLSRGDDILDRYTHRIIGQSMHEGHEVQLIEALPREDAPVVWGKEIVQVRSDNIFIRHEFYDQSMQLAKVLSAQDIKPIGGKLYATRVRMEDLTAPGEWTEVTYQAAKFGLELSDTVFSLSNLQNPRD
ncbi:MAG: outer membrane lipoprotein-sorting protein [Oligoflexia bacterium]|nr:outer membrane lipoprotein-sorting protein [Oligoflexia bacterium]